MDEVGRLRGQSSPGISPRHLDHFYIDQVLLEELMVRWPRCCRTEKPEHDDVALFRSLNMVNFAALMPASVEATMYDVGRSVSLWVSAVEILSPAKASAFFKVYENLKKVEYGLTDLKTPTYGAHGFKQTRTKESLPCWIFGELYKARNDFLHRNPIDGERLTVKPSRRSLFLYTGILYRLALTGFLDLRFKRPMPPSNDAEAFGAYISDSMDYRSPQGDIEAALSTILCTEEEYRARSRGTRPNLPAPPPPSTDLSEIDGQDDL